MKIFSKHRKKMDPHRRFGSREFKERLSSVKNHKRNLNSTNEKFDFFSKTGLSKVGTAVGVAILAIIFYFLVVSPYFLVTNVAVAGNKQVSSDEIKSAVLSLSQKRLFLVPQNNLFLLGNSRLTNLFAQSIPEIASVKASRGWPNKITINVTERKPAVVLEVGVKDYLIDDQGFVVKEVAQDTNLLKITDSVNEDVSTGSTIGGKIIPFVISMQNQWPQKITIPIASAKVPGKGASEVEFVTSEGWSAFFSTDRPVASQLDNLSAMLAKLITPANRPKLAYIDLRLPKWAYYCYKQTACQQTDQTTADSSAANGPADTTPATAATVKQVN